ncbi:hypothetical protein CLU79DRAFT_676485, partial [Phycomyces nitens]
VKTPVTRAVTHTILGAVTADTVIHDTTSAHYLKFINEVLDVMDEVGNMKGFYLVMDNCSIHKN